MKTNGITVYQKNKALDGLNDGYNHIQIVDDFITKKQKQFFTDPGYQKKVISDFTENQIQEVFKKSYFRSKVELQSEFNAFIKTRRHSKTTNQNYKNWIIHFLN